MTTEQYLVNLFGTWLAINAVAFWLLSGYVGAGWLMAKGYWLEIVGCAILAGGIPLLLPAVLGPLFALVAFLFPNKDSSLFTATGASNVQSGCCLGVLLIAAMVLVNVALVVYAVASAYQGMAPA